jgi:hypothetical protein
MLIFDYANLATVNWWECALFSLGSAVLLAPRHSPNALSRMALGALLGVRARV